jgi:ribosomal protein S18 acetylase RimI-like enzyme
MPEDPRKLVRSELDCLIRPLLQSDEAVLWEMLYHAIYVPDGAAPPEREVVYHPQLARYARDWGRADDSGFLAENLASGEPIGAAWVRSLKGDDKGFGYVDEATPELSIAVLPGYRGRGIGTRLLAKLLEAASIDYDAVSLSVDAGNRAVRLYERLGFQTVGTTGTSLTMKKALRTGLEEGV